MQTRTFLLIVRSLGSVEPSQLRFSFKGAALWVAFGRPCQQQSIPRTTVSGYKLVHFDQLYHVFIGFWAQAMNIRRRVTSKSVDLPRQTS